MTPKEIDNYVKAGNIAKEMRLFVKKFIKPNMILIDIARRIHEEIEKKGGKVAFPVNLSINEIAAHFHPSIEDESIALGLLKVDMGIHIDGFIADTALSLDLTSDKKFSSLITASEDALHEALELLKGNPTYHDVGNTIKITIEKYGFSPIVNLSGHALGQYQIHAGKSIPNYGNNNNTNFDDGAYAVEPFATSGEGMIISGEFGNIYELIKKGTVRSPKAREVLQFIIEKYNTLPFSLREIQEKYGSFARLAMKELVNNGLVHAHAMLIERSHKPVSQAEHTFIRQNGKLIITTM